MSNRKPLDQDARNIIEEALTINIIVEAGAGSGKTSCLVKRMVALIKSGVTNIDNMAAITFTKKAADELKGRFQTELERALQSERDKTLRQRIANALIRYDQCFLGTIHSYCAKLLRERPIEAGLDPAFKELDELNEKILIDGIWTSFLEHARLYMANVLSELNEIGISPIELKSAFEEACRYSDIKLVYQKLNKPCFTSAYMKVQAFIKDGNSEMPLSEPAKGYDKLQKALLSAMRKSKYLNINVNKNIVEVMDLLDKELKPTQNRWPDKTRAKELHTEHQLLRESVIQPCLRQWREYCHYFVMEFILAAVKFYDNYRKQKSLMSFQDLLMTTRDLLRDNAEVRIYFQNKYQYLLVDEFQDTDPIQAEIVFYLSGEKINEKDWRKVRPRPGSLFVVGDPKQSIYRFRRADIDTYQLVKGLISENGGRVVELTTNFRSTKPLCDWFNSSMKTILPDCQSKYQAEFKELFFYKNDISANDVSVKRIKVADDINGKNQIVQNDAYQVAQYIKCAIDGNLHFIRGNDKNTKEATSVAQPKDFMIILRYKDSMEEYVKALAAYGIESNVSGAVSGTEFYEVNEFLKVLEAIQDIHDPVKLVAALRGLFIGIDDNSIYQYKCAKGIFSFFAQVPDKLKTSTQIMFIEAFARLKEYHKWAKLYSPIVAIEKIVEDCGIAPLLLCKDNQGRGCGYLYQQLEMLRAMQQKEVTSFWQAVVQLKQIIEAFLENELSIKGETNNQVRIMNLHKAKGLEASVVFLAHPLKKVSYVPHLHVSRMNDDPVGYLAIQKRSSYHTKVIAQPLNWEQYVTEEQKYQEAEEMRLLYVAATRAKNKLIISSRDKSDKKKNAWYELLATVNEVLEPAEIELPLVELTGASEDDNVQEQIKELNESINDWKIESSKPSYREISSTSMKDIAYPLKDKDTSYGMQWGTVIHDVFSRLVKGSNNYSTIIPKLLNKNEIPVEREKEVHELIDSFKKSELWYRIVKAGKVLSEVPFSIQASIFGFKQIGAENDQGLLSGVIDLVFKEDESWVIVDYKTDSFRSDEEKVQLTEFYQSQIVLYSKVWEHLCGTKVKEGLIFYTKNNECVRVC